MIVHLLVVLLFIVAATGKRVSVSVQGGDVKGSTVECGDCGKCAPCPSNNNNDDDDDGKFRFAFVADLDYSRFDMWGDVTYFDPSIGIVRNIGESSHQFIGPYNVTGKLIPTIPASACPPLSNGAAINGNIAFVAFQTTGSGLSPSCSSNRVITNCFNNGARAVLMYQITPFIDGFARTVSITSTTQLPAVHIHHEAGLRLAQVLANVGVGNLTVTMTRIFLTLRLSNLTLPITLQVIKDLNADKKIEFTLGGGDYIISGELPYTESDWRGKLDLWMNQTNRPFITSIGDNDWSDDAIDAIAARDLFRGIMYPDEWSLGKTRRTVRRQTDFLLTQAKINEITDSSGFFVGPFKVTTPALANVPDGSSTKVVLCGGLEVCTNVDIFQSSTSKTPFDTTVSIFNITLGGGVSTAGFDVVLGVSTELDFDFVNLFKNGVPLISGRSGNGPCATAPYLITIVNNVQMAMGDVVSLQYNKDLLVYTGVNGFYFYIRNLTLNGASNSSLQFPFNALASSFSFTPNVPVASSGLIYEWVHPVPQPSTTPLSFPENQQFVHKRIVFASFTTLGGTDLYVTGPVVPPGLQNFEMVTRQAANVEWIRDTFRVAKSIDARGIVFFTQAERTQEGSGEQPLLKLITFKIYNTVLRAECLAFGDITYEPLGGILPNSTHLTSRPTGGKPVLMMRGNSHHFSIKKTLWTDDRAERFANFPLPNFIETGAFGHTSQSYTTVDVDPKDPDLFIIVGRRPTKPATANILSIDEQVQPTLLDVDPFAGVLAAEGRKARKANVWSETL